MCRLDGVTPKRTQKDCACHTRQDMWGALELFIKMKHSCHLEAHVHRIPASNFSTSLQDLKSGLNLPSQPLPLHLGHRRTFTSVETCAFSCRSLCLELPPSDFPISFWYLRACTFALCGHKANDRKLSGLNQGLSTSSCSQARSPGGLGWFSA